MGLLPEENNPAAELVAMGLLPQANLEGRTDETDWVTHGAKTGPAHEKDNERSSQRISSQRSSISSPKFPQRSQSPRSTQRKNNSSFNLRENSPRSRRSFSPNSKWRSSSSSVARRSFSPRLKEGPSLSERRKHSPRTSREKFSSYGASRKRSSSPSPTSRKRTPPKEVTRTVASMNISHRMETSLDGKQQAELKGQGHFSADDACNMLMVICDKLGIIGASFKSILKRALEFEPDTHKMLQVFQESDNVSLMEVVSNKINDLVENSKNSYEKQIMKKAFLNIRALIDKSNKEFSEIVHGVDISHIAKVTFGKDTSAIIQIIKTGLQYNGVMCNQEILGEIYQKVSMRHFSITKSKENHKKTPNTRNNLDNRNNSKNSITHPRSNDNRVGVSEFLTSVDHDQLKKCNSQTMGLTEGLMQVIDNEFKPNTRDNKNLVEKRLEQSHPNRGNSRGRDHFDHQYRDIREDVVRKDALRQNLPYRDQREGQGKNDISMQNLSYREKREDQRRIDRLDDGPPSRYRRENDRNRSYNDKNRNGIDRYQAYRDERKNVVTRGLIQDDPFRDGRGHGSGRGASRKDLPLKDVRDSNRRDQPYKNLQYRDVRENYISWNRQRNNDKIRPKFWEGLINKTQKTMIKNQNETFEEPTTEMPTIQEMMEDLERMQALAQAVNDKWPEEEPEEEAEDNFQEELCNEVTEDQGDNLDENEPKINENDELDDNLKEKFGNKGIEEVPWQDLVKKLAPEDMIKPTDIDDDEEQDDKNIEEVPWEELVKKFAPEDMMKPTDIDDPEVDDHYDHYGNDISPDYYGYEKYSESNIGPGDSYMNPEDNNREVDSYDQNYDNSYQNESNYSNELMIPANFIKDGSRNTYEEQDIDHRYNGSEYEGSRNYVDQRIGNSAEKNNWVSSQEYDRNMSSSYSHGDGYGGESVQRTNTSYSAKPNSYNAYEPSTYQNIAEGKESYKYDAEHSTYSLGPINESQYSQMSGENSYNYRENNLQIHQSGYKDDSPYQQYNESSNPPYDDSGYEAESSEYSIEMPAQFIKPKTSNNSFQNPAHSDDSWFREQIKSLATSNLGKEELAARISQIMTKR
ncbi:unnamed protein product [Meganyctiphanes norvegica]|uniref:Uncharacterized protein n=1 Tax=Meganyctiphanes norvegica TaxID=48144 RepID=A0AAV2QGC2_MEGNR